MIKLRNILIAFLFFNNLYSQIPNPIIHYKLDGDAVDISGNNQHGTIYGNPYTVSNAHHESDKAMYFDGDDYIEFPTQLINAKEYTISIWVKYTSINKPLSQDLWALSLGNSSSGIGAAMKAPKDYDYGIAMGPYGASLKPYGVGLFSDQGVFPDWYHFVMSRDSNGTYSADILNNGGSYKNFGGFTFPGGLLSGRIGCRFDNKNFYVGAIDDFRVYDVALTPAQLTQLGCENYFSKPILSDVQSCEGSFVHLDVQNANVYFSNNFGFGVQAIPDPYEVDVMDTLWVAEVDVYCSSERWPLAINVIDESSLNILSTFTDTNKCIGDPFVQILKKNGEGKVTWEIENEGEFQAILPTDNIKMMNDTLNIISIDSSVINKNIRAIIGYACSADTSNSFRIKVDPTCIKEKWAIFPNPCNNFLKVDFFVNESSSIQVLIYDELGRELENMESNNLTGGQQQLILNTSNLPSSAYVILLKMNGEKKLASKFIIVHN